MAMIYEIEVPQKNKVVSKETLEKEMEFFLLTLSHDMRAPFITLCGFVEELTYALNDLVEITDTALPHLTIEQQQQLRDTVDELPELKRFIDQSVSQLDTFLKDLLTLSRTSRRILQKELLNMDDIIEKVIQSLQPSVARVDVQITHSSIGQCTADREAIAEIFEHVLINALQYRATDRPCQINITSNVAHNLTTYSIEDNGRGISEDEQNKIFEPFYRAGKHDVPGHGMGLAYVRTLVRLHGGSVACTSIQGEGTTIFIYLPEPERS